MGMSPIYVARSPEVAARMLGGEMMIMSARDSTLFSLNETASAIWQAADGRTPLSEIVQRTLCAEYEVAPDEALQHAEELVRELAERGILRISEEPIAETAP
jgi:coenzyme PQQ synthesis protein D (PqqD)